MKTLIKTIAIAATLSLTATTYAINTAETSGIKKAQEIMAKAPETIAWEKKTAKIYADYREFNKTHGEKHLIQWIDAMRRRQAENYSKKILNLK